MTIVKYPQYRDYVTQRTQTNDTVMGLLVGSRISERLLDLTDGSQLTLQEIFPGIRHIKRLNLKPQEARAILRDAESLLAILAIPQIIALQEDLLKDMISMLVGAGVMLSPEKEKLKSYKVHETFADGASAVFTAPSLEIFHLLRMARNTYIHEGGRANSGLVEKRSSLSPEALKTWESILGEAPGIFVESQPVNLGLDHLIILLAVTKRLAEEANSGIQKALSSQVWLEIVREDWLKQSHKGNADQKKRKIQGWVRINYSPLKLDLSEVAQLVAE